ncbi:prolyl 4-hydroxylase subunit alpha-2-like [Folsomia candida]|uniref:prolyl 4-hydroxylase subunit alpha-2-like n=1 Tax=Folsomia candida TaxID=158441 RepID=UPI001604E2C6|nr:prolyl 4-hydroxylase subunit alpha-2-like [Folsomia candida]
MHCDHLYGLDDYGLPTKGHRLSSIVLYMTDVEEGGGTAFPNLGFRTYAEAGSMLYWHAAHTNGEIDFRTSHGGCAAAYGLRWLGVRFIRQFENFQTQKCSLKRGKWLI